MRHVMSDWELEQRFYEMFYPKMNMKEFVAMVETWPERMDKQMKKYEEIAKIFEENIKEALKKDENFEGLD